MEGLSKDKLCSLPKYGLLGRGVCLVVVGLLRVKGRRGEGICVLGLAP